MRIDGAGHCAALFHIDLIQCPDDRLICVHWSAVLLPETGNSLGARGKPVLNIVSQYWFALTKP